jgi:hypothetical protein
VSEALQVSCSLMELLLSDSRSAVTRCLCGLLLFIVPVCAALLFVPSMLGKHDGPKQPARSELL